MKSAIEESKGISAEYLMKMWATRIPGEMADFLHGFYMLDNSTNWAMRDEVRFLQDLCLEKRHMECNELREAA